MLYYCAYTWNPGVTVEEVEPHHPGAARGRGRCTPEWICGYYGLVGGGAGFLLLEVDDPYALNEMLTPTMRVMSWDVRAIVPYDYEQDMAEFRRIVGGASGTK